MIAVRDTENAGADGLLLGPRQAAMGRPCRIIIEASNNRMANARLISGGEVENLRERYVYTG